MNSIPCAYILAVGAVFKAKVNDVRKVMLVVRSQEDLWSAPKEITDEDGNFAKLGNDQVCFVRLRTRYLEVQMLNLFEVTLIQNGDSTTAARALKDGKLNSMLTTAYGRWSPSSALIKYKNGTDTFLTVDSFKLMYMKRDLSSLKVHYRASTSYAPERREIEFQAFDEFVDKCGDEDVLGWFECSAHDTVILGYAIMRDNVIQDVRIEGERI